MLHSSVCLFATATVHAQHRVLKGTIKTSEGKSVPDIKVVVPQKRIEIFADKNGTFQLAKLPDGVFDIQLWSGDNLLATQAFTASDPENIVHEFLLSLDYKQLNDVIVSAIKRKDRYVTEDLGKTNMKNLENPQVYSSVSQRIMIEQNTTNLQQILTNVTGATVNVDPAGGMSILSRGFSTQIGARNGMPIYGLGRSGLDPANIDAVEVLKGPSGTLFGNAISSYGGLVNLVTKKPFEYAKSNIGYTVGSYNLQRITADINTPLTSDNSVLFRVNAAVNKQGSFLTTGHADRYFVAPSLVYQVNERLKLSLDIEAYKEDITKPQFISDYKVLNLKSVKDLPISYNQGFFDNSFNAIASNIRTYATAEYKLSDHWTSVTNISVLSEDLQKSDQGYLYFTTKDSVRVAAGNFGPITTTSSDFQQNFKGDGNFLGMRHRVVVGFDYYHYDAKRASRGTTTLGYADVRNVTRLFADQDLVNAYLKNNTQTTPIITKNNRIAAYASDLINITKSLMVLGSVRYDRYMAQGLGGYNQTSWTPRVGLVFQPILDVVSVFGNYTSGFTNYNVGTQPDGSLFFYKPSFANQWESGVKVNLWKNKLISTISYYNIAINDAPRSDPDGTLHQDGKQKSNGVEFDFKAMPNDCLFINAGYVYNKNQYLRATTGQGNLTTASPKNVANLWVSYKFLHVQSLEHLGIGAGMNYVDKSFFDANNTVILPSYTIFNSSIFYDLDKWRLGFAVNNISNVKYWNATGYAQMPRNVSFNVNIKF